MQQEVEFFHSIAQQVIDFVSENHANLSISEMKREGDFSTIIDIGVEDLIVKEIKRFFPTDEVMAEEGHKDTKIPDGRIWIIDPICGTNNLARDIKNFCTNIALAEKGKLIASCVVDHSHNEYFWSTGDRKIYQGKTLLRKPAKRYDTVIEVDYGAAQASNKSLRKNHLACTRELMMNTNYYLISLNSSLGFCYTAIGKVDGFINISNHPWDICAAVFLIQQAGGFITDRDGNPWKITADGAIAARTKEIHDILLDSYNKNKE